MNDKIKPYIYKVPFYNADGSIMELSHGVDDDGNQITMDAATGRQVIQREWQIGNGLIYRADAEVATWANMHFDDGPVEQMFVGIGVLKPGTKPEDVSDKTLPDLLMAATYYFNEKTGDEDDICACVVSDDLNAAHPSVIRQVLAYAFEDRNHARISFEVEEGNDRSINGIEGLGGQLEGIKRGAGSGGQDVLMFGLLRDECPIWTHQRIAA